jgi:group I intron endonuclease
VEPRAGIYAIICNITGAVYIGSSINIGMRLVTHLVINNTNGHLKNALGCYGLENFTFCIVEFYEVNPEVSLETNKANLLATPLFLFFP